MDEQTPFQRAAEIVGSISQLARVCGVTPSAAQQWDKNGVPAKHCVKIEQAAEGQVTRYELRPDVFGERPQKAAA
jgi:DNA-binding transcriptional regulator YdaS (Cro superfamily)